MGGIDIMKSEAYWVVGMIGVMFSYLQSNLFFWSIQMVFSSTLCIIGILWGFREIQIQEKERMLYRLEFEYLCDEIASLKNDKKRRETKKNN